MLGRRLSLLWLLPLTALTVTPSPAAIIESFNVRSFGSEQTYDPSSARGPEFSLQLIPSTFYASDGTAWNPFEGFLSPGTTTYDETLVNGNSVTYLLTPSQSDPLFDFYLDDGHHSTQGAFSFAGPIELTATLGSSDAFFSGFFTSTSSGEPPVPAYASGFEYFSIPVGALASFSVDYHLISGEWSATTFSSSFTYTSSGQVSLAPEAASGMLTIIALVTTVFLRSRIVALRRQH